MNRLAALLGSIVLASTATACSAEDPAPDATPTPGEPDASVTSLRHTSPSFCHELARGAAPDLLLVEGIEIEGGTVTFRWSTAADSQVEVTSWFSRAPLNALSEGLVAGYRGERLVTGREIRPLMRAWRDRAPLQGATLAPGKYWLLTRAQFPGAAQVGDISYGWDSEGAPGTLTDHWDVRPAGGCTPG